MLAVDTNWDEMFAALLSDTSGLVFQKAPPRVHQSCSNCGNSVGPGQFQELAVNLREQRRAFVTHMGTHVPTFPPEPRRILLKIQDISGNQIWRAGFMIQRTTRLGKLFDRYVQRMGHTAASEFRLMFDDGSIDGQPRCIIGPNDTAETVGLEDQDMITAVRI